MSTIFGVDRGDEESFPRTVETISLFSPGDEDPFSKKLVSWKWLTKKLRRTYAKEYPGFSSIPEKRIRRVVTIVTTIIALFFLVAAIFVLWVAKKTHVFVSLILLSTFVVLFAVWLSIGTVAKRSEVFGASAAYAAVLVVFISQT